MARFVICNSAILPKLPSLPPTASIASSFPLTRPVYSTCSDEAPETGMLGSTAIISARISRIGYSHTKSQHFPTQITTTVPLHLGLILKLTFGTVLS